MTSTTFCGMLLMMAGLSACSNTQGASVPQPAGARTSAAISESDSRHRLYLIADDSMGGRPTGSPGHIKVTQYIAQEMARLGLQPAGDNGSYFQNVPFIKRHIANATLSVDGKAFELWRDFVPSYPGSPVRSFDGVPAIYGGILQDTLRQITREQAAGKLVILFNPAPNQAANMRSGTRGSRLETAAAIATINTGAGMLTWQRSVGRPNAQYNVDARPTMPQPAIMAISAATAAALMGMPVDSLLAPGTAGRTVRGSVEFREDNVVGRNVVAILPGSDAQLRNEYVAIGAHSDHDPLRFAPVDHDSLHVYNALLRRKTIEAVGRRLTAEERAAIRVNVDSLRKIRPARPDSIFNGADDDGSGTVAVLEIAEALAAAPQKPRRSILFIWHVAEELGLYGSRYFTDHPTVPRAAIVTQLNMDMVGRGRAGDDVGGGPRYVQVIGSRRLSSQLGDIVDATNAALPTPFTIDYTYAAPGHPQQRYCRSDHFMYARYGIPISYFSAGYHGDYHQVTDEPQYIDYDKLTRIAGLVRDVAVRVANLDQRLVIDGVRQAPDAPCRQ